MCKGEGIPAPFYLSGLALELLSTCCITLCDEEKVRRRGW